MITVPATRQPIHQTARWAITLAGTIVSTFALDLIATASGAALAASNLFDGASDLVVFGVLAATYLLWFAGLRANVMANWGLLEQTGTSTNLPSKVLFELVRRRSNSRHAARVASAVGYLATELAKEAPYYVGAFGTALLSDGVDSTDALVFLAGTNVGAAVYEYGVAQLSRAFLDRRQRICRARSDEPQVPSVVSTSSSTRAASARQALEEHHPYG